MAEANQVSFHNILNIALTNETLGAKFYATIAANTEDEGARNIFNKLAEEEKKHRHLFQELIEKYKDKADNNPLPSNKSAYFKFLAENNIFATIIEAFKKHDRDFSDIAPKDALSVGIQAEKDSILLYQELFANTTDEALREAISNLLEEEKMHLLELRQQLEEMF